MANIRVILTESTDAARFPDGKCLGHIGEHNANTLVITPPTALSSRTPDTYRVIFSVGEWYDPSVVMSGRFTTTPFSIPVVQDLTLVSKLNFQIEAYDTDDNIIAKSDVIQGLYLDESIEGDVEDLTGNFSDIGLEIMNVETAMNDALNSYYTKDAMDTIISGLTSRISTNESSITSLNSDVDSIESGYVTTTSFNSSQAAQNSELDALEDDIDATNASLTNLTTTVSNLSTNLTSNYITSTTYNAGQSSQDSEIDALDARLTSVESGKQDVIDASHKLSTNYIQNDAGYVTSSYHDSTKQDVIDASNKLSTNYIQNDAGYVTSSYHDSTKQDVIDASNKLSTNYIQNDAGYITSIPVATASTIGGVKAGTGITISADGTISASENELYFVTYGTTSYADVLAAYNASKTIILMYTNSNAIYYEMLDIYNSGTHKFLWSSVINAYNYYFSLSQSDGWELVTKQLAVSSDVTSEINASAVSITADISNQITNRGYITSSYHDSTKQDVIDASHKLSTNYIQNDAGYITSIPIATESVLGGVMVDGTTVYTDDNGVLQAVNQRPNIDVNNALVINPHNDPNTEPELATDPIDTVISGDYAYELKDTAARLEISNVVSAGYQTASQVQTAISSAIPTNVSTFTNDSGYLTASDLPTATASALGMVKPDGTTITINNGIISGASTYTLPTATESVLGGVKVDGTTITATDGIISAANTIDYLSVVNGKLCITYEEE